MSTVRAVLVFGDGRVMLTDVAPAGTLLHRDDPCAMATRPLRLAGSALDTSAPVAEHTPHMPVYLEGHRRDCGLPGEMCETYRAARDERARTALRTAASLLRDLQVVIGGERVALVLNEVDAALDAGEEG